MDTEDQKPHYNKELEDIWDIDFKTIRLPPHEEIKQQLERYGIRGGTSLRLYLGKYMTEEDFERCRAKVLGTWFPHDSKLDKLKYFLDNKEFFFQNWGYKIKDALGKAP